MVLFLLARAGEFTRIVPIWPLRPYPNINVRHKLMDLATEENYLNYTHMDEHYEVVAEYAKVKRTRATLRPTLTYGGYRIYVVKPVAYITYDTDIFAAEIINMHDRPNENTPPSHFLKTMLPCCAIVAHAAIREYRNRKGQRCEAVCLASADELAKHIVILCHPIPKVKAMELLQRMHTGLALLVTLG